MIEGQLVNLRPVTREDLMLQLSWSQDRQEASSFNFFGYRSSNETMRRFEEHGLLSDDYGRFMVVLKDGTPIGDVSYRSVYYGPVTTSRAYNIGIDLLTAHRGKGYGVEAQKLLAQYLFSVALVERIEASTDIENIPEQRALEKAGFTREGVMRRAQFRNGAWHDMVVYSILRGE